MHASTASWPEWKNVPSPMFWKICFRSTKGDIPIHGAPSPPICVINWNARPGPNPIAIVWHPMPPPATWPSSNMVERLCGQPEQKFGKRIAPPTFGNPVGVMRANLAPASIRSPSRPAMNSATISGFSSPCPGTKGAPAASAFPTISGLSVNAYKISLNCVSTKLRFSSTTSNVRNPRAKSRANSGSSGNGMATLPSRIPIRFKSDSAMPKSRKACRTSSQALPVAAIPNHASFAPCHRFTRLTRANARAASRRWIVASYSIFNENGAKNRTSKCRSNPSGATIDNPCGSTVTVEPPSQTSVTHFIPAQDAENRDRAIAYIP